MICVTNRFCCIEFVRNNAKLSAFKQLNPDDQLSDTRRMSGAPQPLVPKGHIENSECFFYLSEILICPSTSSVFLHFTRFKSVDFHSIPECSWLFEV